jgi:putative glutathione S-transferase
VNGFRYLYQVYIAVNPDYSGRVTVPVLWDKKTRTIVSNESSEIIRMFNSAFDQITGNSLDFYPEELRTEIDAVNELVYANVNNGVYRAGFATTQEAYESAFDAVFETLDELDARLGNQRYLVGGQITEADWRLFTSLIRFDAVYHGHFKCNLKRIEDYPNLSEYVRELYQVPGVSETVNFDHIKQHYYVSQRTINPTQIVPKGPVIDLDRPHRRMIQMCPTDGDDESRCQVAHVPIPINPSAGRSPLRHHPGANPVRSSGENRDRTCENGRRTSRQESA